MMMMGMTREVIMKEFFKGGSTLILPLENDVDRLHLFNSLLSLSFSFSSYFSRCQ
jgi:hypothetical protein